MQWSYNHVDGRKPATLRLHPFSVVLSMQTRLHRQQQQDQHVLINANADEKDPMQISLMKHALVDGKREHTVPAAFI